MIEHHVHRLIEPSQKLSFTFLLLKVLTTLNSAIKEHIEEVLDGVIYRLPKIHETRQSVNWLKYTEKANLF